MMRAIIANKANGAPLSVASRPVRLYRAIDLLAIYAARGREDPGEHIDDGLRRFALLDAGEGTQAAPARKE